MIDIQHLKLDKNKAGDETWICGHCGQPANEAKGMPNKPDDLVYMMICPLGKLTLGEWVTLEEMTTDPESSNLCGVCLTAS